ncbi:TonB-dependent receptor [Flavihumibacter rivuli]|uniref:TonB-dependent receptor plug domain-containing protein n=1 Tax=Flavihumibacter rivuli TaxID=2838156 RepID=UPI001BDE842A|nr:TonB-dependent receptor [Flavihumibacter rivuli]ULQ56300.1 TonB-dependent receptor [Flavihumibacter rivuli]
MKKHWLLVAATMYGSHLSAQQDSSKGKTLETVVVTANKIPQKQNTTGKVLTVIDRNTLERNSGRTLAQLLNEQSGVIVNGSQNPLGTNQTIYLRGSSAANTLILVDGMPVTDGSGSTNEFDINHFNIDQIERVEILKGAQSTLYGSDAVAGVINIITRKSFNDNPGVFRGSLAAGSFGTIKGNMGINGGFGSWSYDLNYSRTHSDGFSAAQDASGNKGFDRDGFDQGMFNGSIRYQATKNWTIRAYSQMGHYKADIDDAALQDDKNNTIRNSNKLFGLQTFHQWAKGSFTFNTNYNQLERKYDDPVNDPAGPNDYDPFNGTYKGQSFFAEAYVNLKLREKLSLLAGADYRWNSADINTLYGSLGSDSLVSSMLSTYASLSLQNTQGFGAELGGRFTQHKDFGDVATFSFNPYYNINKTFRVFASYGTAFRAPSVYQLASEYGNRNLEPERSKQWEAGLQVSTNKPSGTLSISYFDRQVKDVIIFAPIANPPYGQYRNADDQHDRGLELEGSWQLTNKFTVKANYTYVDGKITTNASGKDTSFFNLYRRPRNSANLNAAYQFSPKFYVSLGFRWVDERQDLYFNPDNFATEKKTLDAYYNVDAYASYQMGRRWKLFADLRNITDRQYFDLYGYNSRRFNFMTGVQFNW